MSSVEKLAEITTKELDNSDCYCIWNAAGRIIAGTPNCVYYIKPCNDGGWQVALQEFGRGIIYEDYRLATEREACIKFIEMTEEYYHLSKYLSEFEEKAS